jgi:hypothetical protein
MEDFCKFYADSSNKLLYSDIIEKRKRIVEKMRRDMLKETTYDDLDEKNFKNLMDSTKLSKMVNLIDEEFFDGKLIKTFNENGCCLSVCLGNTCGSTAGFCSWHSRFKPGERIMLTLKMMPKVFIKSFKNKEIQQRAVDNIPCDDILTCFFITVCHELVHGILFCNCKDFSKTDKGPGSWIGTTRPGNGHTKTFMSILNNRFGHKSFTHSLIRGITVKELETESFGHHNIKKGDIVILKTRRFDGSIEEKEVLIISAGKVQLKASEVKDPSRVYKGRFYGSILRKVTYPKELKTPILNAKPTKKVTETDIEDKTNEISPKSEKSSTKKKIAKKTKKIPIQDKLIKNLQVGDEVIMNARIPGLAYRSILLVKIIEINRRKKTGNIKVEVAEGEHKGKLLSLNEQAIVTKPENPVLPASPRTGRELGYKYGNLSSIPFTRDAESFDKMETIDVKEIGSRLLNQMKSYSKFHWINISPKDHFTEEIKKIIKSNHNSSFIYFIIKLPNNKIVFADTSGYEYIKYGVIINGLEKIIPDKEFKTIWKTPSPVKKSSPGPNTKTKTKKKTGCNNRNPEPPCKSGYIEKKRPNGSICCYKSVKNTEQQKKNTNMQKKKYAYTIKSTKNNKVGCNKRNPNPPCAPGFIEKKRPNGAVCCYKGK